MTDSERPDFDAAEPTRKRGIHLTRKQLVLGGILIVLLALGAGVGTYQVMKFKAKAEGLATGYVEAAVTAYQMDRYARPLPDRIFESGHYRVETRTHGTPPRLHVSVRDRYLNITHVELERIFDVSGRPSPPPNEGQENTGR
ncbi:MAG: hypothetical protein CVV27_12730 [Candidatus Melainabacteria bacterium HGW-Melainabacteria-1]|nr:MAG: hypothetical protein CVV27_12730 [Candidatus Melainabacteria bacterium HGW-Melainabacteria-1]